LQKQLYQDLNWKKRFFTKSNSSEQNIYRNRRLKNIFNVVVQAKTKHERSRLKLNRYVLKNIFQPFYNINGYFIFFYTLLELEATILKP
jgi:hypothetical protein